MLHGDPLKCPRVEGRKGGGEADGRLVVYGDSHSPVFSVVSVLSVVIQ